MDIKELKIAASGSKRHPWELAKLKVIEYFLAQYEPELESSQTTLLDIGCGDLFILDQLDKQYNDMNLFGIDIAFEKGMIDAFKKRAPYSRVNVSSSLNEVEQFIPRCIDVVLLLDILEHIEHDVDYLKELVGHRFISDETYFIVTAPAFQCLYCSHDDYLGHYRRYTNYTLTRSLEMAGLHAVDAGYLYFSLLFPRAVSKWYEMIRKKQGENPHGVSHWHHGNFLTAIVKNILYYDFRTLYTLNKYFRLNIPGLSNFVICRKKRAS